jgi:integral membrane protein (TIGR01906 family)
MIVSLAVFVNYDKAFEIFHNYFFGKTSWRFSKYDTLLRIYPMKFWFDGTVTLSVIAIIINTVILVLGLLLRRKYANPKKNNN